MNRFDEIKKNCCYMATEIKNNNSCTTENIKAHTISKGENLKKQIKWMKLEKRHVFKEDSLYFKKSGAKTASIFKGFCKIHDELFKSVDKGIMGKNFVYQSVYRQLTSEIYKREQQTYCNEIMREVYDFILKKTNRVELKPEIIANIEKINNHLNTDYHVNYELIKKKIKLENSFVVNKDKKQIELITKEGDETLFFMECNLKTDFEINISTLYTPKLKVNGKEFNKNKKNRDDQIYIFVLNNKEKPKLIISCSSKNEDLVEFIKSFFKLKNKEEMLLKYSILFSNVYYSKDFVENLTEPNKKILKTLHSKHSDILREQEIFIKKRKNIITPKILKKINKIDKTVLSYVERNIEIKKLRNEYNDEIILDYFKYLYRKLKLNEGLKY